MEEIITSAPIEGIDFFIILSLIGLVLSVISIILGLIYYRKLSNPLKVMMLFLIVSVSTDIISRLLTLYDQYNVFLNNIYTLLEFSLLGWVYVLLFKKSKSQKLVFSIIVLLLPILIFYTLDENFHLKLNEFTMAIDALTFILISIGFFYKMLNDLEYNSPLANPIFWINSGILIYFSGSFFSFIFSDERYAKLDIWVVHNFVHVIFMSLILIGFWKTRKT